MISLLEPFLPDEIFDLMINEATKNGDESL